MLLKERFEMVEGTCIQVRKIYESSEKFKQRDRHLAHLAILTHSGVSRQDQHKQVSASIDIILRQVPARQYDGRGRERVANKINH